MSRTSLTVLTAVLIAVILGVGGAWFDHNDEMTTQMLLVEQHEEALRLLVPQSIRLEAQYDEIIRRLDKLDEDH